MRTFITGGAGFIGSQLARTLLDRGDEVTILDDLSTGSADNLTPLKGRPGFRYHIDTFTNVPLMAELIDQADVVYHLAAAVGVRLIVESPVRTIESNVRGTEIVLMLAQKKRRPVFVASTSEVYGKSAAVPFREDGDLVLGPTAKGRWSYACSKAIDEFLALAYWKEKKLPTVIARLFNTVGPGQTGQYGMVLPTFARQAVSGQPITVFGDGTQTRCFTHVKDVVAALVALMRTDRAYGRVVNLGSNDEITIGDLARRVRAAAGSSSEIVYVPYDRAYEEGFEDMPRRVPDTSLARELIGWQPTTGLDEIIADVVGYARSRAR